MKTKTMEYEDFPQVWKNHEMGLLHIFYKNHVETYRFDSSYHGDEGQGIDPYAEIKLAKDNGFQRVRGMKTVRVIDFAR